MLKLISLSFVFFGLTCFGQSDDDVVVKQGVEIYYNKARGVLLLDFENKCEGKFTIKVKKYPGIKSIGIENYNNANITKIIGFDKLKYESVYFTESDFINFNEHNPVAKDIRSLHLWVNYLDHFDTIVIPKEIEQFANLEKLTIGCCNLIDIRAVDLTKFKNLDTLILEGPMFEVNSLQQLKELNYIGLWRDPTDKLYGWKTDSIYQVIDTLLPNTQKVIWCFPPNQQITLYNGQTKSIQDIQIGDTLLSYNLIRNEFIPNCVLQTAKHPKAHYDLRKINASSSLLADIENNSVYVGERSVTATQNHPIILRNSDLKPIGSIVNRDELIFVNNKEIEIVFTQLSVDFKEETTVYNLVTTERNYFVNGFLFSDK